MSEREERIYLEKNPPHKEGVPHFRKEANDSNLSDDPSYGEFVEYSKYTQLSKVEVFPKIFVSRYVADFCLYKEEKLVSREIILGTEFFSTDASLDFCKQCCLDEMKRRGIFFH